MRDEMMAWMFRRLGGAGEGELREEEEEEEEDGTEGADMGEGREERKG